MGAQALRLYHKNTKIATDAAKKSAFLSSARKWVRRLCAYITKVRK
jgi:hypothetical protein